MGCSIFILISVDPSVPWAWLITTLSWTAPCSPGQSNIILFTGLSAIGFTCSISFLAVPYLYIPLRLLSSHVKVPCPQIKVPSTDWSCPAHVLCLQSYFFPELQTCVSNLLPKTLLWNSTRPIPLSLSERKILVLHRLPALLTDTHPWLHSCNPSLHLSKVLLLLDCV